MPQSEEKQPKLLTLKQACELLNCHPNTLRAWDEKGYLVAVRFGTRRDRRYRREDVMKLLERSGDENKSKRATRKGTIRS